MVEGEEDLVGGLTHVALQGAPALGDGAGVAGQAAGPHDAKVCTPHTVTPSHISGHTWDMSSNIFNY